MVEWFSYFLAPDGYHHSTWQKKTCQNVKRTHTMMYLSYVLESFGSSSPARSRKSIETILSVRVTGDPFSIDLGKEFREKPNAGTRVPNIYIIVLFRHRDLNCPPFSNPPPLAPPRPKPGPRKRLLCKVVSCFYPSMVCREHARVGACLP